MCRSKASNSNKTTTKTKQKQTQQKQNKLAHRLELVEVDAVDHAVRRHAALRPTPFRFAALLSHHLSLPHARLQRSHSPRHPPLYLAAAPAATSAAASTASAAASRGGGSLAAATTATAAGLRRSGGFLFVFVVGPRTAPGEVDGKGFGAGGALHVAWGCVDQFLDAAGWGGGRARGEVRGGRWPEKMHQVRAVNL